MKIAVLVVFSCILVQALGVFVPPRQKHRKPLQLLGDKKCTYGPSYWCENLFNAGDCHATKHCIQTVWIHKKLPPDTSSICDTCKQMVEQARAQLLSNETQDEIKQVFEGSCALIRFKPVVELCDKIADDYALELIDTLASEMNPQMVCSTAGLCNNPKFQQLIGEESTEVSTKATKTVRNQCDDCNTVMDIVVKNFNKMSMSEFMNELLQVCGEFSSFSDSCSNIVVKYISDIYGFLKEKLVANDVCLLSGECYTNFHKHDIEITPMSKIGFVQPNEKDDIPCELCVQLVNHLRDILIANTTEAEFKLVLEGICKQTGGFSQECVQIADEYYPRIYSYLVNALNATESCMFIHICPVNQQQVVQPIAPLLLEDTSKIALQIRDQKPEKPLVVKVMKPKPELTIGTPEEMQLPIDLLVPHQTVYNEQLCMFCQYFLHYVQQAISSPSAEVDIKNIVDKACEKLPKSVNSSCIEFVNTYEPALIAILAQEIDPSQVCPMIKACPSEKAKDVEVFMNSKSSDKCPFCLVIVTKIESLAKGKTSKEEIKQVLENVCNYLPDSLRPECKDFVDSYTDELVEMIIADFKPAEVCEYLKFCKDTTPALAVQPPVENIGDTETNAIIDNTLNGRQVSTNNVGNPQCILCEFVMKEIEGELKNNSGSIKKIVESICTSLPTSIRSECTNFVDQYADVIILLLEEALQPNEICAMMKLCPKSGGLDKVKEGVAKCSVCISAIDIMKSILSNPRIRLSLPQVYEKTCRGLPETKRDMESNVTSMEFCDYTLDTEHGCSSEPLQYFHGVKQLIKDNMCTSLRMANITEDNIIVVSKSTSPLNPVECLLCKAIIKEVAKQVKTPKTKEEVKNALLKVCKHLHKFKNCNHFVDKYSDKLVDLILKYGVSNEVCSMLMFCSYEITVDDDSTHLLGYDENMSRNYEDFSDYNEDMLSYDDYYDEFVTSNENSIECVLCKAVVKEVEKEVKGQKNKDKIKNALEHVCKHLHKFKKCNEFVEKYTDKLIDLIIQYENADQVCSQLSLCEGSFEYAVDYPRHFPVDIEAVAETSSQTKAWSSCIACNIITDLTLSGTYHENIYLGLLNICGNILLQPENGCF